MNKIGILGSGVVATTLAGGFIKNGYQVCLGTGHTEKLSDWKAKQGDEASVGSFADAARFGQMLVLSVKGDAALKVLETAGKNLENKTVIDTTNPIEAAPPVNGVLKFFTTTNASTDMPLNYCKSSIEP
ncbi:MAG: DNA-binding protein [Mucilaginibacter sp.]|nr:DNA-binding protein [Mucilaginibacter sp.]